NIATTLFEFGGTHTPRALGTRGALSLGRKNDLGERERCRRGGVPEWPKGADCKSAGVSLRRFESFPHHLARGRSSVGRASAFQAEGHGFEPRRPLAGVVARVAQSVERVLGKDEVTGSIPVASFERRRTSDLRRRALRPGERSDV